MDKIVVLHVGQIPPQFKNIFSKFKVIEFLENQSEDKLKIKPNIVIYYKSLNQSDKAENKKKKSLTHKLISKFNCECYDYYSSEEDLKTRHFLEMLLVSFQVKPKITIYTTSYKSGDRIYRPFVSLLQQTFTDWEWIIFDDTDQDLDKNWQNLKKIKDQDHRIRLFKSDKNSGVIGEVKEIASKLARSEILLELDHDDEILPQTLELVIKAFEDNKDCDFVYSDFTEIYELDGSNFKYGDTFGYGFGGYRKELYQNKWVNVATTPMINNNTIRYISGCPNHLRAWRTSFLHKIGHYNYNLAVVDDYEILVRTFLETKMLRIPQLLYIQYRNVGNNNFTQIRNKDIQSLTKAVSRYYNSRINLRITELGYQDNPNKLAINHPKYYCDHTSVTKYNQVVESDVKISVVISTYNRAKLLRLALESVLQQNLIDKYEIVIVGDNCPDLEKVMNDYKNNKIKWWNLDKNHGCGSAPRNYALKFITQGKYIAYLDDDNIWKPNHLSSLLSKIEEDKSSYAFANLEMGKYKIKCNEPKLYRIDTSNILHKKELLDKYGYWKSQKEVGYANDWELVSRWKSEKYSYTDMYTMVYNTETNNQDIEWIYNYYD